MELKYCQQCGKKLSLKGIGDEGLVPFCENCDQPFFLSDKPCIIVVVVNEENEVILIRQNHLSKTHWVLVAGYIKANETAEETVIREVLEETGQKVESQKFLLSFNHAQKGLLMLGFVAFVKKNDFSISNEVDAIGWFSIEKAGKLLKEGTIAQKHFYQVKDYLQKHENKSC